MSRIRFTALAEGDLEEIIDYIADEASANRARLVLNQILRAADRLAEMPGMGHRREDLTEEDVLFWPVHSYLPNRLSVRNGPSRGCPSPKRVARRQARSRDGELRKLDGEIALASA